MQLIVLFYSGMASSADHSFLVLLLALGGLRHLFAHLPWVLPGFGDLPTQFPASLGSAGCGRIRGFLDRACYFDRSLRLDVAVLSGPLRTRLLVVELDALGCEIDGATAV